MVELYQQELKNLIYTNHDWSSENVLLASYLQNEFGNDWKIKATEYISWRGLENTDDFIQWANDNEIESAVNEMGEITYPYFNTIVFTMKIMGKSNCEE